MDLIDLMQARSERDASIQKVSLNNPCFMDEALRELETIKRLLPNEEVKRVFTGEDLRCWLTNQGISPNHPNAWGALILTAVKRKIIVGTEKYVSMKSVRSHARKTQLYRWA